MRSETEDAFVEAHIVNVAPQAVSGRLCRFLVEENDRVQQGQVLAEIDPVLYRDKVDLARTKVDEAEAELRRQETHPRTAQSRGPHPDRNRQANACRRGGGPWPGRRKP